MTLYCSLCSGWVQGTGYVSDGKIHCNSCETILRDRQLQAENAAFKATLERNAKDMQAAGEALGVLFGSSKPSGNAYDASYSGSSHWLWELIKIAFYCALLYFIYYITIGAFFRWIGK
jgi:hypothetical protein